MAAVAFGTKAETIERMEALLLSAKVLPQVRLTVREWKNGGKDLVLPRVEERGWLDRPLIVRSSARSEDNPGDSLAGHFTSVAGVRGAERICEAIERVIASFDSEVDSDQIFIQPMLDQVVMSGVGFTRDPSTGGHYYIINFDDRSGRTDTVTSGRSNELRTFVHAKGADAECPPRLRPVVAMMKELEGHFGGVPLDVEFALADVNDLYLLQVRPLPLAEDDPLPPETHRKVLKRIAGRVAEGMRPHPYLHGPRTIYGVMPDWNPAEIIGIRPRALALSLYKELVTDNIWAYQRGNYGYSNLRSFPLLINFSGLPYIDVRVSFNSFVPADIKPEFADRLVNYYLRKLAESPSHHDKVEFEVIYSCYTLDLPDRLCALKDHGFSDSDCMALEESLRSLTNRIVNSDNGLWRTDLAKIGILEDRQKVINQSSLDPVSKVYWLMEDCKRYGTLPFAGLARAGFIAVQMLHSLVSAGVLTPAEAHGLMLSLDTVSLQIPRDMLSMSRSDFMKKYGHLRPGTYDVLAPRYDEDPDRYFDWEKLRDQEPEEERSEFRISLAQMKKLESLLKKHGLDHDVIGLLDFIKGGIESRELSKFVFTRSLSDVLKELTEFAAGLGISRADVSHLDISVIRNLYGSSDDPSEVMRRSIREGKDAWKVARHIILPPLITGPEDVWSFEIPEGEPNFITLHAVTADVARIEEKAAKLDGRIVMIPSADPGYDWIFSHNVAGFVTMYGGANSHMAIRAAQLGIPAVVGAGDLLYRSWSKALVLKVDCANRLVQVIR